MSKQNRDVWCDHCDYRFSTQVSGNDGVGTCPNCGKPTLLVTCGVCENQSELSHVNFDRGNWICPQCKEYRDFSAETLTDFLTAQIAIEPSESMRRVRRPSFRVGCGVLVILYVLANILLSSCGDLLSRRPNEVVVVERTVTRVVEITATPSPMNDNREFIELTTTEIELLPDEIAYIEHRGVEFQPQRYEFSTQVHRQIAKPIACVSELTALIGRPQTQEYLFLCHEGNSTTLYTTDAVGEFEMLIVDHIQSVALSPSGMTLAFTILEQGLYTNTISAEVESHHVIVEMASDSPSWSPDSTQIAFAGHGSDERFDDLYIYSLEDGTTRKITNTPAHEEHYPIWSPTGESILFVANYSSFWNVYRYDVASGTIDRLTNFTLEQIRSPIWTPDGRYVVFSADFDGDFDLYALDLTSDDKPIRLFDTPVDEFYPTFQPANSTAEPTENTQES